MQRLAEDVSDPTSEKAAFAFLGRCVSVWGQPIPSSNGNTQSEPTEGIPGFERFLYERVVPTAFRVPSLPEFNLKDGQMMVVSCNYCPVTFIVANMTRPGSPRDCKSTPNHLQNQRDRSVRLPPFRLPAFTKLAPRSGFGFHDKAERARC